jgi:hypothetical protein
LQNIAKNIVACRAEIAKSLNLVLLEEAKSPEFCRPNSQEKIQNFAEQIPKQKVQDLVDQIILSNIFLCRSSSWCANL